MKKLVITDWNTLSMTDDLSTAALQELAVFTNKTKKYGSDLPVNGNVFCV